VTDRWSDEELRLIGAAVELEVAGRTWTPIWVVCTGGQVFVRTWHRRDTGWYGRVRRTGRARIRVPGLETDVIVNEVGGASAAEVDAAYHAKYGGGAGSMVTAESRASTLRLDPATSDATPDRPGPPRSR
jgi:hypothetical protein